MESTDFERRFRAAYRALDKKKSEVARERETEEDDGTLIGVETIEEDSGEEKLAQVRPPTAINLFQHPDAHPVVLDLALLRKYGPEWLTWEQETLEWRVPQDFRTATVSALNMGKVQAIKTLHFNDTFWQRWEVFNVCLQAFNNLYPDFEVLVPPSTAQLMVAIDVANRVREDVAWSDELKRYMAVACKFDGIFCPPAPLEFLEVVPDHDLLNCEAVRARWPSVRAADKPPTGDTITEEQLRRNLDVHRFLLASRQRLQDQLPLVIHA